MTNKFRSEGIHWNLNKRFDVEQRNCSFLLQDGYSAAHLLTARGIISISVSFVRSSLHGYFYACEIQTSIHVEKTTHEVQTVGSKLTWEFHRNRRANAIYVYRRIGRTNFLFALSRESRKFIAVNARSVHCLARRNAERDQEIARFVRVPPHAWYAMFSHANNYSDYRCIAVKRNENWGEDSRFVPVIRVHAAAELKPTAQDEEFLRDFYIRHVFFFLLPVFNITWAYRR